ncbi:MAG TPA: BrnT family toxin [Allosphingosinicella sp.]|nr:BrnT family toxin [Allosphingosinicella sp.]
MEIEFDPSKDAANVAKHGISLNRAAEMTVLAAVDDRDRFEEPRYRLYGMIDREPHCLAAVDRGGVVRVISLRRAHEKELRRYVSKGD